MRSFTQKPKAPQRVRCSTSPVTFRRSPGQRQKVSSILRSQPPVGWLQAKLEVGALEDPLEREADDMAEEAIQGSGSAAAVDGVPLPGVTAVPSGPRPRGLETREEEGEEEIRAFGREADEPEMSEETEARIASLPGTGAPLPASVRGPMERGFGFDFTGVRIYTEPAAAETAQALGAHAYTYRNRIVFAPGRYTPGTGTGQRLLAHELTHVVQQAGRPHSPMAQLKRGGRHLSPAEAERLANDAATNMSDFLTQNILFDFWNGDLRDNDKNGLVDGYRPSDATRGPDRAETSSHDGAHFRGTYSGFKTWGGLTFTGGEGGTVTTVDFDTSTTVQYRVCADLVSAAYRAAGIPVPRTRRVRELVQWFQGNRQARFWLIADFPGSYRPGDFICSYSPREGHGHAGMVVAAGSSPDVVHLPGQSQHIARGVYDPTRLNDVTHEAWPSNRTIYGIGRFVG